MGEKTMRLHDYLKQIRLEGAGLATAEDLRRLHVAHRETFLFENLSIQTGGAVSVALGDIERKFLDEGRGGYCFEHNTLFAAALRDAGFAPVTLLGRVRRGPPERWARTHMVLRVEVPDEPRPAGGEHSRASALAGDRQRRTAYLADVGFGATGLVEPIPLVDGATATQRGLTYRLRREGHLWILSMRDAEQAMDLYEFADEPQTAGDVVVANHYTSTHPDSIFRQTLTIQRVSGDQRIILRNATISRWSNGTLREETIDRAQMATAARELFSVALPEGPFVYESGR
jgi:N-hydroxyarylamine O-acetyltransferase